MKKIAGALCLFLFVCNATLAQLVFQEAPEKWSKPIKVKALSVGAHSFAAEPSLTADGKTIYFYYYSDAERGGICVSYLHDSSWSIPVPLNGNVNQNLAEGASISPDGKRLYFRMYGRADGYGGWDLYSSDWDSLMKDWGPAKNLGPNINRGDTDDWSCMTPDYRHLYMTRYPSLPRVSIWNDTTKSWGPTQWVDLYHFLSAYGRAVATKNGRKIYYDPFAGTENANDIYVNYYDTLSAEWTQPMVLNINKMMDTLVSSQFQRIQQDPWISPDGRRLYFSCTHDSTWAIWMSELLIDENGNPVTEISRELSGAPREFKLWQNFPNPFNPTTAISYQLSAVSNVTLGVYDVLGREVSRIVHGVQQAGTQTVRWNASTLPSGVYYYRLQVGEYIETKKMVLLK